LIEVEKMENIIGKIKELLKNSLVTAGLGFLVGLIIGLPLLGWGLWPVQWTDASPQELRQDVKVDYLNMTIESFSSNKDQQAALKRWNDMGPDAGKILDTVIAESKLNPKDIALFSNLVKASGSTAPLPGAAAQPTKAAQPGKTEQPGAATPTSAPGTAATAAVAEQPAPSFPLVPLMIVSCIIVLLLAGVLIFLLVIRKRPGRGLLASNQPLSEQMEDIPQEKTEFSPGEAPITQFMATYNLGDDLYDDSFAIDSPTGVFLGECGVGISDTIGVGDPKKVTAFEVWLFDKNDIQTVTKVFMSEHAYNDVETSQRLAAKGEPVLVEPNKHVLLETATLQLEARIVDMNYAQGALPPNSYFSGMILELSIWPKPGV
jgi:hypothetical protein